MTVKHLAGQSLGISGLISEFYEPLQICIGLFKTLTLI
jgi:hypothetical protein